MPRLKQLLVSCIPNVKMTTRVPWGGRLRYRARVHKGLLVRKVTDYHHEKVIFDFWERRVSGGMTVFDVGANIGMHTVSLGLRLRPGGGAVHAFEPDPDNLLLLRENLRLNGLEQTVTVVPKAADVRPGEARFWRDVHSSATGTLAPDGGNTMYHRLTGKPPEVMVVPTTSIDHYCRDERPGTRPQVIKIDVEGAEAQVVTGAAWVLREFGPDVVLDGATPQAIDLLRDAGYAIYDLLDAGRRVPEGQYPAFTTLASRAGRP
jgi:FkbM family methyltransferase